MEVSANKQDILAYITLANKHFNLGIDQVIEVLNSDATINNDIYIKYPLPLGASVTMTLGITAGDGYLEVNIENPKAFGMGGFGLLRVAIAAVILKKLNPYQHVLTSYKAKNGNLHFGFPGVNITSGTCSNGTLFIDITL